LLANLLKVLIVRSMLAQPMQTMAVGRHRAQNQELSDPNLRVSH
jgi:hypothetical protein